MFEHILKIPTTKIRVPPIYSYEIFFKVKNLRWRILSDLCKYWSEGVKVSLFMITLRLGAAKGTE
jgi:hypothetical protein